VEVVCLYVAAWGVAVVVLVEVGFGVGLRFCVARRFINWISALHSLLGGRVERFDRCKTRFTRRFINADTYIAYISMCMGDVRLAAYAERVCGDAAPPTGGCLETASSKCVSVDGDCGGQSRRSWATRHAVLRTLKLGGFSASSNRTAAT
jgi:hypothetical protein